MVDTVDIASAPTITTVAMSTFSELTTRADGNTRMGTAATTTVAIPITDMRLRTTTVRATTDGPTIRGRLQ